MDREKVIVEIEDALSGNLAKAGYVYKLSLNGLKDKALIDALAMLKEQEAVIRCKDCKHSEKCVEPYKDYWCNLYEGYKWQDWFCADGERKDI